MRLLDAVRVSMASILSIIVLTTIVTRLWLADDHLSRRRPMLMLFFTADAAVVIDLLWGLNYLHYLPLHTGSGWLSAAYYISMGFLCYVCFLFSEIVQQVHFVGHRPSQFTSPIPFLLLVVLSIASIWTGWIFRVDEQGHYQNGPMFWAFLILAYNYPVFTSVSAFLRALRRQHYDRRDVFLTLAFFVLPLLVCGVLQAIYPGIPILCVGISLGALLIYTNSLEQQISQDGLTGLNNRMQLVRMLASRLRTLAKNRRLFLMMMDADGFKLINDRFGHVEGDRALITIAESLKAVLKGRDDCFCARYGGDEFTLVVECDSAQEADDVVRLLRADLKQRSEAIPLPYPLTLSIGRAEFNGRQSIPELINAADKQLYRVKPPRGTFAA